MITGDPVAQPLPQEALEELTGRCLVAQERILANLVLALPPRSKQPLRDLTLDQLDLLLRVPMEGCDEGTLVAARGGNPADTRPGLAALRRRRLLIADARPSGRRVELTPRGLRCRADLRQLHRTVVIEALAQLSPAQLQGLLSADDAGGEPSSPASLDSLVDKLLALRTGISAILGASLSEQSAMSVGLITLQQQRAINLLPRNGTTMREFARLLSIAHGSATAMADRMVRQGLLERQYDARDRRLVRVVPTAKALEIAELVRGLQREAVAVTLGRLSDQQRAVLSEVADLVGLSSSELPKPANGHGISPALLAPR